MEYQISLICWYVGILMENKGTQNIYIEVIDNLESCHIKNTKY